MHRHASKKAKQDHNFVLNTQNPRCRKNQEANLLIFINKGWRLHSGLPVFTQLYQVCPFGLS